MADKKYRDRRGRRNRNRGGAVAVMAVAVVLLLCAGMWRTYSQSVEDESMAHVDAQLQPVSSEMLQQVVLPPGTPEQQVRYIGFNVSFNADAHQPNYVVWELLADETDGAASRKGANFFSDPAVDGCASLADYRGSGYSRGHMAPAADFKWDMRAMIDSHSLANVCPQVAQLNGGAWSKLENNCRAWARRDSAIIIVGGPILTDIMTDSIGRGCVPVPRRFFKVVLAPWVDMPRGIGFIMPNAKVDGGVQSTAVSIDQVEAVTGIDFFAALPDDIEADVESQCNYARWQKSLKKK